MNSKQPNSKQPNSKQPNSKQPNKYATSEANPIGDLELTEQEKDQVQDMCRHIATFYGMRLFDAILGTGKVGSGNRVGHLETRSYSNRFATPEVHVDCQLEQLPVQHRGFMKALLHRYCDVLTQRGFQIEDLNLQVRNQTPYSRAFPGGPQHWHLDNNGRSQIALAHVGDLATTQVFRAKFPNEWREEGMYFLDRQVEEQLSSGEIWSNQEGQLLLLDWNTIHRRSAALRRGTHEGRLLILADVQKAG